MSDQRGHMTEQRYARLLSVECPFCGAIVGDPCEQVKRPGHQSQFMHTARACVADGLPLTGHQMRGSIGSEASRV